jgi:hypothetical protein
VASPKAAVRRHCRRLLRRSLAPETAHRLVAVRHHRPGQQLAGRLGHRRNTVDRTRRRDVAIGVDEDANLVWAVEQVIAGQTVATPPQPAGPTPSASTDPASPPVFSYLAMTPPT